MRVVEAGPPWTLEQVKIVEKPDPRPGRGEILVRTRAISLNYRDLLVVTGAYGRPPKDALIPCSDACGIVEAVGEGVSAFKPGDRVSSLFFRDWVSGPATPARRGSAFGAGGVPGVAQELMIYPETALYKPPAFLTDEQVATLPCAALTAWKSLFADAHIQPGETVLLQGTGGVSIFGLQFAKAAGARAIITSSSDEKLARCKAMGADETINYKTNPDWSRQVRALTGGLGADFIMEVGGGGTLEQSMRAIRLEGHIAIIGVLDNVAPPANFVAHMTNNGANLKGVFVGARDHFEKMCAAIELHRISPVVDVVFPFADIRGAFAAMRAGTHFGKIAVKF